VRSSAWSLPVDCFPSCVVRLGYNIHPMKSILHKVRYPALILALVVVLGVALFFGLRKTVTLSLDGVSRQITTYAFKVSDLLRSQSVSLSSQDQLTPSQDAWLKNRQAVTLVHAIPVQVLADGEITSIYSPARTPSDLLAQAGVTLHPNDRILSNGQPVEPAQTFPLDVRSIPLQVVRSVSYTLTSDGQSRNLTSAAPTLGSALWADGITIYAADRLSPAASTPLTTGLSSSLTRARRVTIQTQFGDVTLHTASVTVGEALQAAHLAPQGLDYSTPSSVELIPSNGKIRLVRVTEQVLLEQSPIPFEKEYQPVSDLDLDSTSIIQVGEYGLSAVRVRVRFEDGQEVSRQTDSQWVARQPQPRIIGYGTNIVMHTTTVDDVTIQYWREIKMYATSYHPSEVGDTTASGLPLQKGVAAVDTSVIPMFTQMYVPGYGQVVAADIGGGVVGRWIDLGYSDSDYVGWHSWVTVYLLWPPPDNIVWVLP
jgi:uncharacterized protein YabE (DUF348 family)